MRTTLNKIINATFYKQIFNGQSQREPLERRGSYVEIHNSVSGMSSSCISQCSTSPAHWPHQVADYGKSGILSHSAWRAVRNSWTLPGYATRCRTWRSRRSQTCSMGDWDVFSFQKRCAYSGNLRPAGLSWRHGGERMAHPSIQLANGTLSHDMWHL